MPERTPQPQPATVALPGDGAGALEGSFTPGAADGTRGAVIAPPHPLYGGSMESPVVGQLAFACGRAGIASLAFNWRGVGASTGAASGDFDVACEDYGAALDFVEDSVAGPIVACGYSFGSATAVLSARGRARLDALLLIAPPISMLDTDALHDFDGMLWICAGARDELAPVAPIEALVAAREGSELVVLDDVDHFFMNGLSALAKGAEHFLRRL